MRAAIAGNQDATVRVEIEIGSAPIGGEASRPLDDRNHRAEIVRLEARFKDEVDEAAGKQTIGIAIGAETRQLDRTGHAGEGSNVSFLEHVGGRGKERGASERGTGPAANHCVVQGRRAAGNPDPALARKWLVYDAEDPPLIAGH